LLLHQRIYCENLDVITLVVQKYDATMNTSPSLETQANNQRVQHLIEQVSIPKSEDE
jgi:hypothetical protein